MLSNNVYIVAQYVLIFLILGIMGLDILGLIHYTVPYNVI